MAGEVAHRVDHFDAFSADAARPAIDIAVTATDTLYLKRIGELLSVGLLRYIL